MPGLKGGSLTQPTFDPLACEEAMHAGATCSLCISKFKLCRGHFVYEPFTVVLFEAFATITLGVAATVVATVARGSSPREAVAMLADWRAVRQVAPIGATYALGDMMDLVAAGKCSATTLLVASQLRLPLCALLRSLLLGRGQTMTQWVLLVLITAFCVGSVLDDIQEHGSSSKSAGWLNVLETLPLILGKCVISCCGAVHAEHFLQHGEVRKLPLAVTQVHFKAATALGALAMGFLQGRRGGRILADQWHGELFQQLPPGTRAGDPRTPFFGGWDGSTLLLCSCMVAQNFLVGDQLRRMSSVAKYVAYALGLVLSHAALLASGRPLDVWQSLCCAGIAVSAVLYVGLPAARGPAEAVKNGAAAAALSAGGTEGNKIGSRTKED